jgi:alkanesulfonate monooxygenase SsuD/methylene tetrahydromethanopterin reductase-like flavin-dependent oxidoreductase (luciferase family)
LSEHLEQVRFARDNGFDSVFAGQHFLSAPFQMLQPTPLLARLAAESGDLTIGSGIFLAALLNPVELAEQVATLDIICGGRFDLGAGLGYRDEENMAFGLTSHRVRVLEEKLDIVRRLLEGERVTATGHGYRLEDTKLSLRSLSEPRPPIWLAANSDAAVRRAARLADTWFVNPHTTVDELERQLALFKTERGTMPSELPAIREVCVRRTDEEAIDVARPFLDRKYKAYVSWGQSEALPPTPFARSGKSCGKAASSWEAPKRQRSRFGSTETASGSTISYSGHSGPACPTGRRWRPCASCPALSYPAWTKRFLAFDRAAAPRGHCSDDPQFMRVECFYATESKCPPLKRSYAHPKTPHPTWRLGQKAQNKQGHVEQPRQYREIQEHL